MQTFLSFKEGLLKILEIQTENPNNIKDSFSHKIYCHAGQDVDYREWSHKYGFFSAPGREEKYMCTCNSYIEIWNPIYILMDNESLD